MNNKQCFPIGMCSFDDLNAFQEPNTEGENKNE